MRVAIALFALVACGGAKPQQPNAPAQHTSPTPLEPGHKLYYQYDDVRDRYMCSAPPSAEPGCSAMSSRDGSACKLVPPVAYWDPPMQCSGERIDEDRNPEQEQARIASLATPACLCSCDAAYVDALAAHQARVHECGMMP